MAQSITTSSRATLDGDEGIKLTNSDAQVSKLYAISSNRYIPHIWCWFQDVSNMHLFSGPASGRGTFRIDLYSFLSKITCIGAEICPRSSIEVSRSGCCQL